MSGARGTDELGVLPGWVPAAARNYLRHTEQGLSIREVARGEGAHASTILRQIRRFESRRDDPLVDEALARLGQHRTPFGDRTASTELEEKAGMTAPFNPNTILCDEATVIREAKRILRRLCEPGAFLAVAPTMEKAAVLRETGGGGTARIAVIDRAVAQAFALKEWISCTVPGKVARYRIAPAGRAALKRLLAEDEGRRQGFADNQAAFGAQHRSWGERSIQEDGEDCPRRVRYNMAESPITLLARRRDKEGKPFLSPELVSAAERFREDFELAQMGPKVAQNWERFLTGGGAGEHVGVRCTPRTRGGPDTRGGRAARSGAGAWRYRTPRLLLPGGARSDGEADGLVGSVGQDRLAHRVAAPCSPLRGHLRTGRRSHRLGAGQGRGSVW